MSVWYRPAVQHLYSLYRNAEVQLHRPTICCFLARHRELSVATKAGETNIDQRDQHGHTDVLHIRFDTGVFAR